MKKLLLIICATLTLSFVSQGAYAEGDAKKGKKQIKLCLVCHKIGADAKHHVGPMLNNIVGAKAGAQEGFSYSKAMKKAAEDGLVWTEENLSEFIKKPKKFMPGTNMKTFAGIKKDKRRANIIAYLKTLTK